ncbi:MAG TPA: AzlD domain-containing protein [Rhodoblastus sp.]|nr:AzlD domain-containing protein [Rhodoblastus sp.]
MNLSVQDGGLAPYLILILFGFLPSEIWRWLSFFVARGVNEGSELFVFARTVASVLLVGVVGKLIFAPLGALAGVPLAARLGALVFAFCCFMLARRSVLAAVLGGEAAIVVAAWWWG